jgi:hypothetical protein
LRYFADNFGNTGVDGGVTDNDNDDDGGSENGGCSNVYVYHCNDTFILGIKKSKS